jgi:hypothetical protein
MRLSGINKRFLLPLSERQLRADLIAVDDATRPESPSRSLASYVLEAGDPRILPA